MLAGDRLGDYRIPIVHVTGKGAEVKTCLESEQPGYRLTSAPDILSCLDRLFTLLRGASSPETVFSGTVSCG